MSQTSDGCARPRWLIGPPEPAWLFLAAGLMAIGSAVLIPAAESLDEARHHRDVALTWEQERLDRLIVHEAYLASVRAREPATIAQLRAIQLNAYPVGMIPIEGETIDGGRASASVFAMLEPKPRTPPAPPAWTVSRSHLARWATAERSRLWLLAGGALGVMLGLLPACTPGRARSAAAPNATVPA
jgi:hypothetical protein